jgi:hypothetical protein
MSLKIQEIKNTKLKKVVPIKEVQNIFIPDVETFIPNRNGFIYLMAGSGGSGKTSLLLSMFKSKFMYRCKFNNIYLITPENSFNSVVNHPFKSHDKVYHELSVPVLETIYQELTAMKEESTKEVEKKKPNMFDGVVEETKDDDDEPKEIQYSVVIIDDYANVLKQNDVQIQLSKMLIKARHLCCAYIFTLQAYYYMPKILRRQITNITIFKPKNTEEFIALAKELLNMKQDNALELFNYCFNVPYNHLDVDTTTNTYYKNWNLLKLSNY